MGGFAQNGPEWSRRIRARRQRLDLRRLLSAMDHSIPIIGIYAVEEHIQVTRELRRGEDDWVELAVHGVFVSVFPLGGGP